MAWKTVTYESIDIRDGVLHEIFVTAHDEVKTKNQDDGKPGKAQRFFGIENGRGPVVFLATDVLAKELGRAFPMLIRIHWKGKVPIKGGERMFNVFACEKYEPAKDEAYPSWTVKSGLESLMTKDDEKENGEDDDFPDVGHVPKDVTLPDEV